MTRFLFICLALTGGLLSGCGTVQTKEAGGHGVSKHANGKPVVASKILPENVTFGNLEADLIYELLVAEIAIQRERPEFAVKYYLDLARVTRDPEIAARAVRIASYARDDDLALEAVKIWLEGEPDNLEARRVSAILYLRAGQNDAALEQFEILLTADPAAISQNLLQFGALLRRELDKAAALEVMGNLVANHQDVAEGYYSLATLAVWAEDTELADSSIDRALALNGEWVDAVMLKGRVLQEQGDLEGAMAYLKAYLKKHPKEYKARLAYARTLVDARRYEDARGQFELLAVQEPGNEDVLYALAMLALQFDDLAEAKGYLEQIYRAGNRVDIASYYLGQIAERAKRDDEALQWYAQVRSGEFRLDAQLRAAAVLQTTKGLSTAREHLRRIPVKDVSEQRDVLLFEGSMLRNAKRYDEAFEFYTQVLKRLPGDTDVLYSRALVAERLDKLDVTERDLRQVLKKQPDNVAAINALGYTLADRTNRHEEALGLIQRALEIEPNDPAIIDSMGWVQYRLGRKEEALEYLRQAFGQSHDPEIAAHLGEVLWVTGKQDEARDIWTTALEKDRENEVLLKVLERFGK